ncbi:aminomethyltransferase family protein [Kosakonia cowanii]|uniref:aminomethyltransferase family protein n=1 Tax=Kosakonia cowanii TaxID=208223 RepID=UPI0023F8F6E6|nr:aminomethyltransferase family protein [Kosakonia cowanii]MDF7761103.1 aminomethyltransferase family protein [Kosakonia cowanii]
MKSLHDLHLAGKAKMGLFNNHLVPAAYYEPAIEYKAVRESALLVDYSHMSIVSVMGDDAWALVNHLASADVSIIRDEQGLYSLVLNEDGTIKGDIYILCTPDGYYILSENIAASDIINSLDNLLQRAEELEISERPAIKSMAEEAWGALMVEGPYSWELLAEVYGFDIIGLPYHEYINQDGELILFRCGKHGEFGYLLIGPQSTLVDTWSILVEKGEKYHLKTGGLDYLRTVRIENMCWDESIYADFSRHPVELQMQWAVQYDKEGFIGKDAVIKHSREPAKRKIVGISPLTDSAEIAPHDKVSVDDQQVGVIVNSAWSPALGAPIALALLDYDYAWSDISGFTIETATAKIPAKTQNLPFLYNLSLLVSPTEHSYIDAMKARHA